MVDWRVDWTLNSEVPGSSPALTNRLICFSVVPDPAPRPLPADIFKDVAFDLDLFEDIELGIWVYQYSCYCKLNDTLLISIMDRLLCDFHFSSHPR